MGVTYFSLSCLMGVINEIQIIDNQKHNKMKTTVFTIAAILGLAFGTANLSKAAVNNDDAAVVLTNVSKINKIEIHGNVEVFVSAGNEDKVKVYNHYYAENALVQSQNGVLRISSYTAEKLVVWVTANQLQSISAYDNAAVESFGKLSGIALDVDLHNHATAKLELNSYSADINVNDNAKVELTGSVTECELNYAAGSTVNRANFTAEQLTHTSKADKTAPDNDLPELAIL
jgi:hypothetical protein